MKPQATSKQRMSPAEYLAMERTSDGKHEYFNGEVFAMAGVTREHSLIAQNISGELREILRRRPCEVHGSDMKVRVSATGLYTYPDVSVVCGPPKFADEHGDVLLNPLVLFEVLSDSTEGYDRGEKFEHYRSLPSLREFLLVSQKQLLVEQFTRQPDGGWLLHERRAGDNVALASLECAIAVDEIYLKVFPPPEEAPAATDAQRV